MTCDKGRFFGVGVGPGDPELMTLKAVNIINACDVIAAPRTKSGQMLALDIAKGSCDIDGKTIVPMDFVMDRDPAKRQAKYSEGVDKVAEYLYKGMDVAMVNLGDVSIYATVMYIIDILDQRGYETVMIPGITSFSAIAATIGTSLTEMNEPLHIIPASAGDLDEMLELKGNKVLMKSASQLTNTIETLKAHGMLDKASLVANCGLPNEVVMKTIAEDEELPTQAGYFTTLIVKG